MAEVSGKKVMKGWKDKIIGLPIRLIECCSRSYWVQCNIPTTSTVMGFTVVDGKSSIGEYTFINRFCEITRVSIGNYCSIGSGVQMGSGEHNLSLPSTSAFITGHVAEDLTQEACALGHDVWVGTHAFIKRGVTVGNGAVIGAHAVVTKDVPDYAIVVGCPARIIKYRFNNSMIERLMASVWWDEKPEEASIILQGIAEKCND